MSGQHREGIPFRVDVALGKVPRWIGVNKFGSNPAVGTSEEGIWEQGGDVNWPAAASQMKVSSSLAADDLGSTGAEKIRIYGLDANYDLQDEEVTLDGQTQVTTTKSYIRVFRAIVTQAGSGGINAGVIYVYTGTETNGVPDSATAIYTTIAAGEGQTLQAFYTVPRNYRGALLDFHFSSSATGNNYVTGKVLVREFGGAFVTKEKVVLGSGGMAERHYQIPTIIPARADIQVVGVADLTNVDVEATFCMYLIQDDG